ncbi:MAG: hypothetical protein AAF074_03965, partial [Pseudomonadota bacterium]
LKALLGYAEVLEGNLYALEERIAARAPDATVEEVDPAPEAAPVTEAAPSEDTAAPAAEAEAPAEETAATAPEAAVEPETAPEATPPEATETQPTETEATETEATGGTEPAAATEEETAAAPAAETEGLEPLTLRPGESGRIGDLSVFFSRTLGEEAVLHVSTLGTLRLTAGDLPVDLGNGCTVGLTGVEGRSIVLQPSC